MKQQLKKLVYERALEKYGEISDYNQYRIFSELEWIKEMSGEDAILCFERIVSISKELGLQVEINQEAVKSSFVCYLLGISRTNPIEANLRFELPENLGEITTEQSMETFFAIHKAFTAEDEMLFFGELILHAPKEEPTSEPTENR